MIQVLGLCSYPTEAAATRFRLEQFIGPLREHGIELSVRPFLNSHQFADLYSGSGIIGKASGMVAPVLRRAAGMIEARQYDVLLVQREAMIFGPALFERLYRWTGGLPLILDLDDATYVRYLSPSYGRAASFLKFFGKTDSLIRQADLVVCGNRFIAEYVESKGTRPTVIPTVVDTDIFSPIEKDNAVPLVGWIGTHSTFPFLRSLFPILESLARDHQFKLRVVGSGAGNIEINGVEVENVRWSLENEVSDFQSLDIGLYPIRVSASASEEWIKGKSGFKAIQYLAVGVPFVMSPVGVCSEIAIDGETHFLAATDQEWYDALKRLLVSAELRRSFGKAGRRFALENYSLLDQAKRLASAIQNVKNR